MKGEKLEVLKMTSRRSERAARLIKGAKWLNQKLIHNI